MSDSPNCLHLVRTRPEWELKPFWYGAWYYHTPKRGGAVRAFASAKRAAAFHRRLEQRARAKAPKANPFLLCRQWEISYELITSLPEFALLDWIQDAGLAPPTPPMHRTSEKLCSWDWYQWWRENVATMTSEQHCHLWEGLDHVRFYEVVTVEME